MSGNKGNILITGTSRGIGSRLKKDLESNFNILGLSRTQDIICDLSKDKDILKLVEYIKSLNIKLDVIILNAGVGLFGNLLDNSIDKHIKLLEINLLANIKLFYHLSNLLKENSKVICIGSITSKKFLRQGSTYQASKFGLRGFIGGLKYEFPKINFHIIHPKIVDTDFHKNSKITMQNYKKTTLDDISKVVFNIIDCKEDRFEIDL